MTTLFDPISLGNLGLANRVVMAPMTRSRSAPGGVPTALNALYYAQRAGMGLIISEGANISTSSCAFEHAPGIWSAEQIAGWRAVTDAVHDNGGRIFLQLWHAGRAGASGVLGGQQPLSPSGINDDLHKLGVYGLLANGNYVPLMATPSRAMTQTDIDLAIAAFRDGARNALHAGFDGVELHAANGYLPHQFLSPTLNTRTDNYGGTAEKRLQFLREVIDAIAGEVTPERLGVRVSPFALYNNPRDSDPATTFAGVARLLEEKQVAYLHFADMNGWFGAPDLYAILDCLRPHYHGPIIANGGISPDQARTLVADGLVQMVAFGRYAMANPDLVLRLREKLPLTEVRSAGWYGGGAEGYTDYSTFTPA
jgi:2,4-dienoyl-CoA reductase-like NADH-dependent reductase (Old Yellow Enzyme family)